MSLTPDQARALWDAGGFSVLTGLPPGSEVGMDGTYHAVNAYAGHKFVPPGLHVVSWCAATTAETGGMPLRSALVHFWKPRERVALAYDPKSEEVTVREAVEDAELRALDPQMAPYPFEQLEKWKSLTGAVTPDVVHRVFGGHAGAGGAGSAPIIDGLTPVDGDVDNLAHLAAGLRMPADNQEGESDSSRSSRGGSEKSIVGRSHAPESTNTGGIPRMRFPRFDLKRSWRKGASGEQVTKWAQDKSQLWSQVAKDAGGPMALLGFLELAFMLVTEVWSYPALSPYKRILTLLCRSPSALARPEDHGLSGAQSQEAREAWIALVLVLAAQLRALPETAFQAELPEMDTFYQDETERLRGALGAALGERAWWPLAARAQKAWEQLDAAVKARGWDLAPLAAGDEDDDEDEEGEYAPVVVEA